MPHLTKFQSNVAQRMGYSAVYFVVASGQKDSLCKIGVSNNALGRFKALQSGSPVDLEFADILFVRAFPDAVDRAMLNNADFADETILANRILRVQTFMDEIGLHHYRLEAELHEKFKAEGLHVRGEWFSGGYERLVAGSKQHVRENHKGRDYLDLRSMLRKIRLMQDEAKISV
jgi:hypothetical protein